MAACASRSGWLVCELACHLQLRGSCWLDAGMNVYLCIAPWDQLVLVLFCLLGKLGPLVVLAHCTILVDSKAYVELAVGCAAAVSRCK